MPKAGDEYRELVGTVAAVLDQGSTVRTEQWIEGPDGERDMDVEVRGTLDGHPHFVLIECKDHARPVGIGYVDAFESKCRDLKPDRKIMFSNSGFTKDALRKFRRVGIEMLSAIKAKDDIVKIQVHREVVARRLTMHLGTVSLFPFDGQPHEIEENWKLEDLLLDEISVIHWVSEKMNLIAAEHDGANQIRFLCTFRPEARWSYHDKPLMLGGLRFNFSLKKDWVAQTVKMDVSIGYYDHLKKRIVVPPNQWYSEGLFDSDAWEEMDEQREDEEAEPNTLRLSFTIFRSNVINAPGVYPRVDELIAEHRTETE